MLPMSSSYGPWLTTSQFGGAEFWRWWYSLCVTMVLSREKGICFDNFLSWSFTCYGHSAFSTLFLPMIFLWLSLLHLSRTWTKHRASQQRRESKEKSSIQPCCPKSSCSENRTQKGLSFKRGLADFTLYSLWKKKSEFSRRRGDSWQTEHHFIPWYFIRNAARFLRQKQVSISCRAAFPSWPGLPSPCGACAVRCWTSVVFSLDLNTPRCGPWPSRPELLMSLKNSRLLLP